MSRVHWDRDIVDGKYVKINKPEYNWTWTPQHAVNMHAPERFGFIQFTQHKAGEGTFVPIIDHTNELVAREILMRVYYAQCSYSASRGRYASTIEELISVPHVKHPKHPSDDRLTEDWLQHPLLVHPVTMDINDKLGFIASLAIKDDNKSFQIWHVRGDCRIESTGQSPEWVSLVNYFHDVDSETNSVYYKAPIKF